MQKVRTIFLSDIHLGTRACQAGNLLAFLREYEAEQIYLVGDIIDFWSLSRSVYWPALHNTVVQKVLRLARHEVQVFFIPGNHDEAARDYVGSAFGDIRVEREMVHVAADGRRYLVTHGDDFDEVTRHHRWVAQLGDVAYTFLLRLNMALSFARRSLGISGYWSLAGYAKRKVKGAVSFISDYEASVVRYVRQLHLHGVVCGHIHSAAIHQLSGITYINCGDWVESCTAIVEHADGRMELIYWRLDRTRQSLQPQPSHEQKVAA